MVKAIVSKAGTIFLSFAVCSVLLELGLSAAHVNTKATSHFVPGVGAMHIPHAYYRNNEEGFSEGYFNSLGFRDYERSVAKPDHTYRILVFGDSFVEALQVPLEKTFPVLLESKLNSSHSSFKFEVWNFGHAGVGTTDEYNRYLKLGVKYSPDLVLVAFLTGSDFRDNSKFLNAGEVTPYYVFDSKGELVLDRTALDEYERGLTLPKRIFQYAKRKSHLANLISERISLISYQARIQTQQASKKGPDEPSAATALGELSDFNIYAPAVSNRWNEAFSITKAVLRKFRNSVEKNGQKFVLVSLTNAIQLDSKAQADLKAASGLSLDFDEPERMLEDLATSEQISYLELLPVFRDYRLRTGKPLHGFDRREQGHWNETGHRLAAETMFRFLTERHLVPITDVTNAESVVPEPAQPKLEAQN